MSRVCSWDSTQKDTFYFCDARLRKPMCAKIEPQKVDRSQNRNKRRCARVSLAFVLEPGLRYGSFGWQGPLRQTVEHSMNFDDGILRSAIISNKSNHMPSILLAYRVTHDPSHILLDLCSMPDLEDLCFAICWHRIGLTGQTWQSIL